MITLNPNKPSTKPNINTQRQSFGMKYDIFAHSDVPDSFVRRIEDSVRVLPNEWGKSLEREGYIIHCAGSIESFIEKMHLPRKVTNKVEAMAISHPLLKCFVFTPEITPKDTQRVVNHEISHGIVDSEDILGFLDWNCIKRDSQKQKNQRIDSKRNPYDINKFLRRNLNDYQKNEIVADIFAWQQPGGGLWGSGHKGSLKDTDFLKKNFPITYEAIGQYEIGKPKHINEESIRKIIPDLKADFDDEIPF